jgi:hypothetical protein
MPSLFHPLLALIASATDKELARYVEYLKEENKILRARIPGQIHTRVDERERLLKLGKPLGKAIEFTFRTSQPHFAEASWQDFPAYCAGIASASRLGGN